MGSNNKNLCQFTVFNLNTTITLYIRQLQQFCTIISTHHNAESVETLGLFPDTKQSHLGVMRDSNTRIMLHISSLFHGLVLVAVTAKNPISNRYVVGNGGKAFGDNVRIFCFDFNPDCKEI